MPPISTLRHRSSANRLDRVGGGVSARENELVVGILCVYGCVRVRVYTREL